MLTAVFASELWSVNNRVCEFSVILQICVLLLNLDFITRICSNFTVIFCWFVFLGGNVHVFYAVVGRAIVIFCT